MSEFALFEEERLKQESGKRGNLRACSGIDREEDEQKCRRIYL